MKRLVLGLACAGLTLLMISYAAARPFRVGSHIIRGERFAPLTLTAGEGARVTVANAGGAEEKDGASRPCPLLIRFFVADGTLLGKQREIELDAGHSEAIAAEASPPGLIRAIVSIRDGIPDPDNVCHVQTTFELYDISTGITRASLQNVPNMIDDATNQVVATSGSRKETLPAIELAEGERIRVTIANVLIPAGEAPSPCPIVATFFAPDGSIIGEPREAQLRAGASFVAHAEDAVTGVNQVSVSLKDGFNDQDKVCALKAAVEAYNAGDWGDAIDGYWSGMCGRRRVQQDALMLHARFCLSRCSRNRPMSANGT
jgi:hypothetical protein